MLPEPHIFSADDVWPEYPFSHPDYSHADSVVMRHMFGQVSLWLEDCQDDRIYVQVPAGDNWQHRFIVPQVDLLLAQQDICVVGFFGQTQTGADARLMNDFDKILIAELRAHPGILCYCSTALASGEYCNLVLFGSEDVKENWANSDAHRFATRHLAPNYYASVRIHNGVLGQGLADPGAFVMTCTKYYSYMGGLWQAVRYYA